MQLSRVKTVPDISLIGSIGFERLPASADDEGYYKQGLKCSEMLLKADGNSVQCRHIVHTFEVGGTNNVDFSFSAHAQFE